MGTTGSAQAILQGPQQGDYEYKRGQAAQVYHLAISMDYSES